MNEIVVKHPIVLLEFVANRANEALVGAEAQIAATSKQVGDGKTTGAVGKYQEAQARAEAALDGFELAKDLSSQIGPAVSNAIFRRTIETSSQ